MTQKHDDATPRKASEQHPRSWRAPFHAEEPSVERQLQRNVCSRCPAFQVMFCTTPWEARGGKHHDWDLFCSRWIQTGTFLQVHLTPSSYGCWSGPTHVLHPHRTASLSEDAPPPRASVDLRRAAQPIRIVDAKFSDSSDFQQMRWS